MPRMRTNSKEMKAALRRLLVRVEAPSPSLQILVGACTKKARARAPRQSQIIQCASTGEPQRSENPASGNPTATALESHCHCQCDSSARFRSHSLLQFVLCKHEDYREDRNDLSGQGRERTQIFPKVRL